MLQMAAEWSALPPPVLEATRGRVLAGHAAHETMTNVANEDNPDRSSSSGAAATSPDPDVLRQLVEDHSEAVYRVALSVTRDQALAEDVSQETLIKAWQALSSFRGDAPLRS